MTKNVSDSLTPSKFQRLVARLRKKEFRDEYCSAFVRTGIAYQIQTLRDQRNWLQKDLASRAGKPQSVISRLEDPDYGKFNVQSLLELAATFDVALLVRFVSYSEFIKRVEQLSPEDYAVPSFEEDTELHEIPPATEVREFLGSTIQSQQIMNDLWTFATTDRPSEDISKFSDELLHRRFSSLQKKSQGWGIEARSGVN